MLGGATISKSLGFILAGLIAGPVGAVTLHYMNNSDGVGTSAYDQTAGQSVQADAYIISCPPAPSCPPQTQAQAGGGKGGEVSGGAPSGGGGGGAGGGGGGFGSSGGGGATSSNVINIINQNINQNLNQVSVCCPSQPQAEAPKITPQAGQENPPSDLGIDRPPNVDP